MLRAKRRSALDASRYGYRVEELSPSQLRLRSQIEAGIACAGPFLDAVLALGERISRLAEPRDFEHYPVRLDDEPESAAGDRRGGRQ